MAHGLFRCLQRDWEEKFWHLAEGGWGLALKGGHRQARA